MENKRVVIDTNVFISSIIGRYGYPYKIFDEFVFTGEIILCFSSELFKEYREVPKRLKFRKYPDFPKKAKKFADLLKEISIFLKPKEKILVISDKSDNMLLEIAVEAQANYVITGNTDDFKISEFRGIKILTPRQYYEMLSLK